MSTGASFKRFKSRQDLATPPEFLEAVTRRFGKIEWDLAAREDNRVAVSHFGPGSRKSEDALAFDWSTLSGLLYCNPPFEAIPQFVHKMARECRDRAGFTLLLTPSSSGSNWARECEQNGYVLVLEDRIQFVGETKKYPKDLMLTVFGYGLIGRDRWHWDLSVKKAYERTAKPNKPRARKTTTTQESPEQEAAQ